MKLKTFILTFLMMSCSIVFGQGTETASATTEAQLWLHLNDDEIGTISLANDIKITATCPIPNGKKVTIDLNGHKLFTEEEIYIINNEGKLTITDNSEGKTGTISSTLGIYNGVTPTRTSVTDVKYDRVLTINGGVFNSSSTNGNAATIYNYRGVIKINGGEFYGEHSAITNYGMATIANAYIECLNRDNGAAAIINDFEIAYGENVNIVGRYTTVTETAYTTGTEPTYLFAELNGVKYPSLQAALDACTTGDINTINLLFHNSDNATVSQKEGVNIIIDGDGYKDKQFEYSGTIYVNGNSRYTGAETLTIQDVDFYTEKNTHDFISCNSGSDQFIRYAHNVTVQNCNFNAKETSEEVVALRFRQSYNINVKDSKFTNLHSAMWATGTSGIAFDNIEATNCKEGGISVGTSTPVSVNKFIMEGEGAQYGVRADGSGAYSLTVANSTLEAEVPVIVRNTTGEEYKLTVAADVTLTATNGGPQVVVTKDSDDVPYVAPTVKVNVTLNNDASTFGLVAKIGNKYYSILDEAFAVAPEGQTITLLADATPVLTSQSAITKAAVIDLGGKTLTLTEDDLYFGTTTFQNGNIVVDPSVKASTAVFWMFENQTLTFDNVNITATGVTGTYLIGINGGTGSNVNLLNGTNIIINNASQAALSAVICDNGTNNNVKIENSTIDVKNIEGRFYLGGTQGDIVVDNTDITLNGVKEGFYLRANQTLSIGEDTTIDVVLNETEGRYGINFTDVNYTYTVAETATVNATVYEPVAIAQIGTIKYPTLQGAIDAVKDDETITLLADCAETVTFTQTKDISFVLDGNDKTYTGSINITARAGKDAPSTLVIKNFNFETDKTSHDFIKSVETNYYPNNITITGCSFKGTSDINTEDYAVVAVRLKSANNIKIEYCTGTGLHSFLQNTAGWDMTIGNVEITNSLSGFAMGTIQGVNINNCDITAKESGIRLDAQYDNEAVIESNKIEAFIPVVVRKASVNGTITFNGTNEFTETNTDGLWLAIGTSEYKENGVMPTAPTASVSVTLNDTNLNREGIYGSALNGEGTVDNPYLIETVNDLVFFRDQVNGGNNYADKHVKLADNIDLSSIENWTPIGDITYEDENYTYHPTDKTKVFSGEFNGNGKVISNLKVASTVGGVDTQANVGLFGITGEGAVIKDLTLTNVNIETDGRNVGALAGFAYNATLDNITVNGDIDIKGGNNVSGVAGMTRYYDMSATDIKVVGNDGSAIVGNNIVGGIFAEIAPNGSEQTFKNLSVENVAITGASGVGGIVGLLTLGTVENVSVKNVALTGNTLYNENPMGRIRLGSVAGLMGGQYATIANVTTENVTAKNLEGTEIEDLPIIGANYGSASNATEAKIGDTYYATLKIAINASQDNDEIVLLDNVTDVDPTISKKVTLNLNEKTITDAYIIITSEVNIKGGSIKNVNEPYPLVVQNGGKLTVDGVGIEASKSDRAIWVRSGSELVFNNSSILATKGEGNNKTNLIAAIYTDSNTDVTINSGTITVDTPDNKAVAIYGNYENANVTVNGGKISTSGKNYSYGINVNGDITVTGGEIVTNEKGYAYPSGIRYGYNYALVTATGNVTITGGSITTNGHSGYAVNVGRTYSSNDQTVSITGGTFTNNLSEVEMTTGHHNAPVLVWTGTASTVTATIENGNFSGYSANLFRKDNGDANSTLEVSGGTFDREINGEYLAKGYAITANENGTYGVSLASYVVLPEGVTAENYKEKFGDNTVTDGTNYYATMTAALNAVYGTETTLYCKPGANVGQMTHGAIKETLTVYGNDAYTSGNGDFDIGNCNYEGKEITSDITLTVKHLDGCGAWGYKNTEHTINIVFENCKDMSEVYLSGTAGRTNITMTNCEFTDNVDGGNCKVYSNADGTITLKDMLFSGVDKAVNFNHKSTGTQTIALENCTFTNCGDDVAGDEIPVRVLSSVAGGNSVLTVTDCTFSGTPEGGADILLDYGVGLTEATVSNTAAKVVVEKENNVGETTIVAANETKSFVNLVPVAKIGDAVYYTFEDAIAAAVADASITSIEILRDYTQTYYIEAGKTYSILENQNLTVVAPEGKSYTITLDRTIGETFSIYQKSANSSLTIADNVTIEGLDILANGFATSGNNTNINGTLKAMSLKQWTSNGTITVSETGKVWLGYGDGQFDLANGNGAVVINGNGDKTEAQFKAGYSGTRGNGNTLTLNDTYFEAGAWFNLNGSNGTININNSLLKVSGGDAAGKMTIKAGNVVYVNEGGTLECANITLEEGATIVVNGGTLKATTLTNNGTVVVSGESTLNIQTLTGESIKFLDGAIINNSTVGGNVFVAGDVTFRGDNTFAMLYDYGTLTDYYGTTAPMKWNVEKGASVTLTEKARYGLGYGDEVTVIGNIENALTARENLSDDDRSLFMHGLVAQESSGWNCNSKLTVKNAYVVLGSNNSFGNKPGNYGGTYKFDFNNSVVDGSRITFYEANSQTEFTLTNSDVRIGTFMTRDADSKFILTDSKVLSTADTNGNDEGNYNAGELVLNNSSLTYTAAFTNTGVLNIGENSNVTAPTVINNGIINFTSLTSILETTTEGLVITLDSNYPDHKVVYKDGKYQVVEKDYVAQIGEQGYETLAEAATAAQDGETIQLLWEEGDAAISMAATFVGDKTVTIKGKADVDWGKGWFYVGRNGAADGKVIFDNANLTSVSYNSNTAYGINVSGRKKGSTDTYNGTVEFKNSTVVLDYLIQKNVMTLDNSTLTVKNGCSLTGRPADETENGELATSTTNLNNGSKLVVNGQNGMNLGYEGYGVLNIDATSTFEATENYGIAANGTMKVNGGNVKVAGKLDNNGTMVVAAESNVEVTGNLNVNGTLNSAGNITANIVKAPTATIQLTGGIYTTEPQDGWCAESYGAFPYDENSWVVREISGEQTIALQAGWNWMSSYISKFDTDGLTMLTTKLGDNGIQIKNNLGSLTNGGDTYGWYGTLNAVSVKEMYKVNVVEAQEFKYEGSYVNYDECVIPLYKGWNYIGYPVNERMSLADALAELDANVGDVIKAQNGTAVYTEEEGWFSFDLTELVPGEGYMYQNTSNSIKQLTYTTKKTTSTDSDNRSSKYWTVDATQYPSNMTMIAMTDVEGGDYEVAAFVNGELRGSSRPVYVESLNAHILVLTISGDEVAEVTFKYYDIATGEEVAFKNRINYSNDAVVGSMAEPYMLTRGTTGIGEASLSEINIYPNPTTTGTEINLQATCDKVEVFNALGVKVAEYQNVDTIDALETAGIYVIRITNNGNVQNCRLVVK